MDVFGVFEGFVGIGVAFGRVSVAVEGRASSFDHE